MIEVSHLVKDYGPTRAVDDVSFSIHPGEVVGLLGPNGAGKTTTMKIVTTFLQPTAGSVTIDGLDTMDNSMEVRRRLGYLPENAPNYGELIVLDYLNFVADVRGIGGAQRLERMKAVAETCGIHEVMGKPIANLSKGYRQRVGLAAAMIHNPPILILDEPTTGLDPNQIVEVREVIRQIGKERTVILSTHNLAEVQATCDRVVIIHRGKIVADSSVADLTSRAAGMTRIQLALQANGKPVQPALESLDGVNALIRKSDEGAEEERYLLEVDSGHDLRGDIFRAAVDQGWTLLELRPESASLEEVFQHLTR